MENAPRGTLHIEQDNNPCPKDMEHPLPSASGPAKAPDNPSANVYAKAPDNPYDWCYLNLYTDEAVYLERKISKLHYGHTGEVYFRMPDGQADLYIPNVYVPREPGYAVKPGSQADQRRSSYRLVQRTALEGLVFLQGTPRDIIKFLKTFYPGFYLMKDSVRLGEALLEDRIAVIPSRRIAALQQAFSADYTQVRFLNAALASVVKDQPLVRMITGALKGQTGYVVRMRGDRHFVFRLTNNLLVCVAGVHADRSQVVSP